MMRKALLGVVTAALVAGVAPACSDDAAETDPSGTTTTATTGTGGAGGVGGQGGEGGVGGQGGAGGASCETETDPMNCGECGNVCAPGQTCVAGACTCGTASVSFAQAVQPILTASCAKSLCHSGALPKAGLSLVDGMSHAELVNVEAGQCNDGRMRVLPGEPSMSYVIDKVMAVDLCVGKKMPPAIGSMLDPAEIQIISDWICAGALDD
jgi:hypothetical protein